MKSDRLITTARQFKKLMLDETVHTIKVYPDGSDVPKVFHVERRGRWYENDQDKLLLRIRCSKCNKALYGLKHYNYCPNCGARMEGADDE